MRVHHPRSYFDVRYFHLNYALNVTVFCSSAVACGNGYCQSRGCWLVRGGLYLCLCVRLCHSVLSLIARISSTRLIYCLVDICVRNASLRRRRLHHHRACQQRRDYRVRDHPLRCVHPLFILRSYSLFLCLPLFSFISTRCRPGSMLPQASVSLSSFLSLASLFKKFHFCAITKD